MMLWLLLLALVAILGVPWILYWSEASRDRRQLWDLETRVAILESQVDDLLSEADDPDDPDEVPVRGEPSKVVALSDRRAA
jgi:hypothetical protein